MSERDESHSSLYLINKKLVDLNKIVSIVEFNRVSLVNGIDTIKDRYHDELTNIFNDHANIMQNILDELQRTRIKTEEEVKMQYNGVFKQLNLHLNVTQNLMKEELLSNLTNIDFEIKKITEFLCKYESELESEIKNLNKYNHEGFNNIIISAKEKVKNEINLLDNESKMKYNSLVENNKQRFKTLDNTFQRAVIDLKKKFFLTTKDQDFFGYIETFKSNSFNFYSFLDENRNIIFKIEKEHKNIITKYKILIKETIDEFLYLQNKFRNEIQEAIDNNEAEILKLANFFSQIHDINKSEKERLNERLNKAKNTWIQEKEVLQNEIKNRNDLLNSNFDLSAGQIEELKKTLNSKISYLKEKFEREEEEINKTFNSLVFKPEKDPDDYSFRLKELRKMHNTEIDFLIKQNQNEITNLNNEFTKKKSMYLTLFDIINRKKKISEDFKAELKKIEDENDSFLIKYKNNLKNEQITEKSRLEEKNNTFLSELDLQIKDAYEDKRQKRFNRISELENQRLSYITNLKHEFKTDKVIDNFISKYHEEYLKLNEEFANFDETISKSQLTKDDIENEKEKLKEKERSISEEKAEILKKWQYEINLENERHQKCLLNNKLSSDDEINNKLNNELLDIRVSYMNRFNEKENLFSELQIILDGLREIKIDFETPELDETIKNLRENLEKLKIECEEKLISEENASKEQFYSPLLNQIKEQQNKNFQDLQIEKRKIEIEISDLTKKINDDQSLLNEAIYNGNKSLNREMLSFQLNEQKMKNDHTKNVDDITNIIIEARKELNDLLNRNIDEEISQNNKKMLMVQNATITQHKKEMDRLIDDKITMEKKLNLEFKKMKAKCQEIHSLYNSKETRPEEQKIIDRLEEILEIKSQSLTSSLKDMMSYRTHLQVQEEYYNTRFGASPKIGIAMLKHRASSQIAKNLPPL